MFSLYNTLKQCSINSKVSLLDINPEIVFGRMVAVEFDWTSPLDYINNLISGFYESEYKLILTGGCVSKTTTQAIDCVIDTEPVYDKYINTFKDFESLANYYIHRGNTFSLYTVYKEYDAETQQTTFTLSQLTQELE